MYTAPTANILVKRIELPFNRQRVEFEWQGEGNTAFVHDDPWLDIKIPRTVGTEFWLGHLCLVVVDPEWSHCGSLCALADGRAYQMIIWRWLYRRFDNAYRRFILTLFVWGLADVPQGAIPSWRHIGRKKCPPFQ